MQGHKRLLHVFYTLKNPHLVLETKKYSNKSYLTQN